MRAPCGAALLCIALTARADPPTSVMNIMHEGEFKFAPSKVVPGAANTVVWGNPAVAGQLYIVRNRFSPGTFSTSTPGPSATRCASIRRTTSG